MIRSDVFTSSWTASSHPVSNFDKYSRCPIISSSRHGRHVSSFSCDSFWVTAQEVCVKDTGYEIACTPSPYQFRIARTWRKASGVGEMPAVYMLTLACCRLQHSPQTSRVLTCVNPV
jgi:hypothetical protein